MFQNQLHLPIADGAQLQREQSLGMHKREIPRLGPNTALALGLCGEAPYHKTFTCPAAMLMEQTWKVIFRGCSHHLMQEIRHRYSLLVLNFKPFPRLWEQTCRIRQVVLQCLTITDCFPHSQFFFRTSLRNFSPCTNHTGCNYLYRHLNVLFTNPTKDIL